MVTIFFIKTKFAAKGRYSLLQLKVTTFESDRNIFCDQSQLLVAVAKCQNYKKFQEWSQ